MDRPDCVDEVIPKGLPSDWADVSRGPKTYILPETGWRELMVRYAGMTAEPLKEIFRHTVGRESPTRALLESGYIDEDYRDEYINFYAKTYRELPRRCERLHFFKGIEDYLGYVVLRPIVGRPVCRTMLRPPELLAEHVSCIATYSTTPWGYRKHVEGFPFMSQDSQFGSCAHVAIWMVALYFHLRFRRPRYHLSDFASSARDHHDYHPAVPTGGLTPRQISAVLQDLDMTPVIHKLDGSLAEAPEAIACRYLDSRLPVILLTEQPGQWHAKVLIGYGRDDGGLFFVHHDDQAGPYLKTRRLRATRQAEGGAGGTEPGWQALVVPMPGKIFLLGEAAVEWARRIIEETIDQHHAAADTSPHLTALAGGLDDGRLRLRAYVTEVAEYKRGLRDRDLPEDVVVWHTGISTSHWLWVVELQSSEAAAKGSCCVLGEIVIDATSDEAWPNPLFGNLPGLTMHWPSLGDDMKIAASGQDETPYLTGRALHVCD